MNITLLFVLTLLITLGSYRYSKRRYFSLTFISSGMLSVFSFIYIVFFSYVGKDLSLKTVFAILVSEWAVVLGEGLANCLRLVSHRNTVKKNNIYLNVKDLRISKEKTILFFLLTILTALLRFRRLIGYVLSVGIGTNFDNVVSSSRSDFVDGIISFGPVLAALYYVCQVGAYIYMFIFVYNIKILKRKDLILLLPIIGYGICIITTTARSEYIKLGCAFITSYFICMLQEKKRKLPLVKVMKWCVGFAIFFIWFGFAIRGINYSGIDSILDTIIGYTCASFYGLDIVLNSQLSNVGLHFGENTLDLFYDLLEIETISTFSGNYSMAVGHSNIYTSIAGLVEDFGIGGMFIVRIIATFVSSKIIDKCINCNFTKSIKFYLYYIFVCHIIYMYLMIPVGDKFKAFYLNPKYLLEILAGFIIFQFIALDMEFEMIDGVKHRIKTVFSLKRV